MENLHFSCQIAGERKIIIIEKLPTEHRILNVRSVKHKQL